MINVSKNVNAFTIISNNTNTLKDILKTQKFIENKKVIKDINKYINWKKENNINFTIDFTIYDNKEIETSYFMKIFLFIL